MAHDYGLSITNDTGETVSLSGKFEDEEWERLEDFVEYATDLLNTQLVRDGISASFKMQWSKESGGTVTTKLPPWDNVIVFLHKCRPLILQSERTFFYNICSIMTKELAHPYFRNMIEEQRNIFKGKGSQELIRISSNYTILNSEKVLYDWLNSFEYHRVKGKRAFIESLHTVLPLEVSKVFFLGLLYEKARAINNVAALTRVVLRKQDSLEWRLSKKSEV